MKFLDYEEIKEGIEAYLGCLQRIEERKKKDREEFLNLLLDDEVIKNNRQLQEKYMELYDKYTSR